MQLGCLVFPSLVDPVDVFLIRVPGRHPEVFCPAETPGCPRSVVDRVHVADWVQNVVPPGRPAVLAVAPGTLQQISTLVL